MSALRYGTDHTWARPEADGSVTVGITHYAQAQLGDVVFVELPAVGRRLARGDAAGVVESVKSASDVLVPVGGVVTAVNDALGDAPELVNAAPETDAWFLRLAEVDPAELEGLLDAAAYARHTGAG